MIFPKYWGDAIMTVKMLKGMALGAILATSAAEAQSLKQIGGPASAPPAGFQGQQFVDSRGCLFLRAGYGSGVNWVARVDRKHKPICNMVPTGSAAAQAAVAADMAPDPQAVTQAPAATTMAAAQPAPVVRPAVVAQQAPVRQVAAPSPGPKPTLVSRPVEQPANPAPTQQVTLTYQAPTVQVAAVAPVVRAPVVQVPTVQTRSAAASSYQGSAVATSVAGVQCYSSAPVLERVSVSGGTALVCTRGDGSATGWLPPMGSGGAQVQVAAPVRTYATAPAVAQVQAPAVALVPMQMVSVQAAPMQVYAPQQPMAARSHALPKPPKGWVYAWKDDRLNPLRGAGTVQGQVQQDQVWQRTIPMVLLTDPPPQTAFQRAFGLRPAAATQVYATVSTSVSTMSASPAAKPVSRKAAPVVEVSAAPAPKAGGGTLIQVGCFADASNAQAVVARLSSLGLPVSTAHTTRKGKTLRVVYAGPFSSGPEASSGLATVHGAGYGDAFLR